MTLWGCMAMRIKKRIRLYFLIGYFFVPFMLGTPAVAAEEKIDTMPSDAVEKQPSKDEDSLELIEIPLATIKKTSKWAERQRDFLSDTFYNSAVGLDNWMGGERTEDVLKKDESYIRVRLRSSLRKSGEHEREAHVKMRLDLPNTRRRIKLFFESSEEDTDSLLDKTLPSAIDTNQKSNRESVAGFRFFNNEKRKWKISNDIGIRSRLPLEPFWRFEARRTWQLPGVWVGTIEEKLWYFDAKGFGTETKLYLDRPIKDDYSLRLSSQAQYQERYGYWQFVTAVSTVHLLNENSSIAYGVGVTSNSRPSFRAESYFITSTYRKKLYKDWLFLEVRPELVFSKGNDFDVEPAITAEIDIYFTN